jgi:hypothetical protein
MIEAIANLQIGETGYTVPWALRRDRCSHWLVRRHVVFDEPRGMAQMKITRHVGGFEVVLPRGWRGEASPPERGIGLEPVTEVGRPV